MVNVLPPHEQILRNPMDIDITQQSLPVYPLNNTNKSAFKSSFDHKREKVKDFSHLNEKGTTRVKDHEHTVAYMSVGNNPIFSSQDEKLN